MEPPLSLAERGLLEAAVEEDLALLNVLFAVEHKQRAAQFAALTFDFELS